MRKLGFGIIGCGAISHMHAGAVNALDSAELLACSDVSMKNLEEFSKQYGITPYKDVEKMLEDERIDIVSICTPSGLHKKFCVMCAEAKKHIVVEKPMALTPSDCDEIIEACRKNNVKMEVISQNRFKEAFIYVKKIVEEGYLGKIVCADIYMKFFRSPEYYASSNWKGTWKMDGGGALMNQGIHGIDILLFIMGKVKSVFGYARTLARDIEVEDTASAVVEFESGALGVIQGTTSVTPGYPRRLEINGDRGSIEIIDGDITVFDVEGLEKPDFGIVGSQAHKDPMAFEIDGHVRQINDLLKAIECDGSTSVDQYEGKKPVELIMAIYESSKTGRQVFLK
ncbi:MAG: Gfo/Idh/MocA family oxidoreductase [Clostridia bacterium]|nr:Gfo/Idh/MocA family oxidoreductase [Clostridia bacterium]MBN2883133.1 Gfo/Idh/MocA family oxidoreductase [Clostridia bacterium]